MRSFEKNNGDPHYKLISNAIWWKGITVKQICTEPINTTSHTEYPTAVTKLTVGANKKMVKD